MIYLSQMHCNFFLLCCARQKCIVYGNFRSYLVGAGLADPDGVFGLDIVLPNAEWPVLPPFFVNDVTDRRDGRCCAPTGVDVFVGRR